MPVDADEGKWNSGKGIRSPNKLRKQVFRTKSKVKKKVLNNSSYNKLYVLAY